MGRDSLAAGHLAGLLQHCRQQAPHLLLLMGPFLDEEHPHIRSGTLDEHFEAVFEREARFLMAFPLFTQATPDACFWLSCMSVAELLWTPDQP